MGSEEVELGMEEISAVLHQVQQTPLASHNTAFHSVTLMFMFHFPYVHPLSSGTILGSQFRLIHLSIYPKMSHTVLNGRDSFV